MDYKLHHVGLLVKDFQTSLTFYRDVLDNQVTSRWQNRDIFNVAFVGTGSDATIELVGPPFLDYEQAFIQDRGYGMNHISFQVDDADAAFAELKAKGLQVAWEPRDMVMVRQCAFYDPQGILVEIFHHLYPDLPLMPPDPSQTANICFHHVDLLTDDWESAQQFYTEHFGLRTIYQYVDAQGGAFVFLVDPFFDAAEHNFMLEIVGSPFAEEREEDFYRRVGPGIDHLAYVTEDVPGAWQRTLARGAENLMGPYEAYGATIAWIKDPDGNDIEIMTPIPRELYGQVHREAAPGR